MVQKDSKQTNIMKVDSQFAIVEVSQDTIKNLIYIVREQQVMLDSDLAMLYQVETGALNRAVKRNISRFPEDFWFQLTKDEYEFLKCQFGISKIKYIEDGRGGRRTKPYVFTEQGISMLSSVLHSDVAINVSIGIMRAFVEMRKFIENTSKQKIFFDGQIYDAFSLLVDLIGKAEKSIMLVDNYVDIDTLNILAKKMKDVRICIYTVKRTRLTKKDIENFNKQYPSLEVKYTGIFHDRFLILDESVAYHIGASLKDAGKKCFGINLLEDKKIVNDILQRLKLESGEEK